MHNGCTFSFSASDSTKEFPSTAYLAKTQTTAVKGREILPKKRVSLSQNNPQFLEGRSKLKEGVLTGDPLFRGVVVHSATHEYAVPGLNTCPKSQ